MTPSPNGGHQTDETLLTTRRRLGDELRHLRSAQRLSLRRVAETLGLAPSTLSAYERGRRPLPPVALRQLCVLYRVPVRRLVAVLGNREMNAEERADDCLKIRFDFDGLEAARSPKRRGSSPTSWPQSDANGALSGRRTAPSPSVDAIYKPWASYSRFPPTTSSADCETRGYSAGPWVARAAAVACTDPSSLGARSFGWLRLGTGSPPAPQPIFCGSGRSLRPQSRPTQTVARQTDRAVVTPVHFPIDSTKQWPDQGSTWFRQCE